MKKQQSKLRSFTELSELEKSEFHRRFLQGSIEQFKKDLKITWIEFDRKQQELFKLIEHALNIAEQMAINIVDDPGTEWMYADLIDIRRAQGVLRTLQLKE